VAVALSRAASISIRLQPETDAPTASTDVALPDNRPRTTLDLAVAKLRTALQERSGYIVVTAESAAAAEALFATVEPRLATFRTVRTGGAGLDPEVVVRALWRDGEAPFPARLAMRTLLDEARVAAKPIVVAITGADAVDPTKLERVRLTLEGTPDAGEIVRIALLGGPGLIDLLRQPGARAVAMRIGASVAVPTTPSELPTAVIVPTKRTLRARRLPPTAIGLTVAAVALAVFAWSRRHAAVPPPAPPVPAPVAANPPAVVREVEPAANATTPPEPQAAPVTKEPEPPPADPEPAPAPLPEPAPPTPEAAPPRGPALQVGAFVRAEGAEALRKKLAQQFPAVWVSPAKQDGTTFHRVRVGGFRSTHDLDLAAAVLRTNGYKPLRVRE
jgi:cell division septation protein DedD